MAFLNTMGIVIKEVNVGEADKIVTILTKNYGRISALAKGGKRPKSAISAASQIMCYSDFVLYSGKEMYSINSCEVIEPFYEIRNDMEKLTYAAHFMDIVLELAQEDQPAPRLLQLLLNSLYMLAKTEKQPELISRIFELRALSVSGYAPHTASCIVCGQEAENFYSFSFSKCGFICDREKCSATDKCSLLLSTGASRAMQYIIYSKMKDLFKFRLSDDVLDELERVMKRYLREQLERDFTKLDFLKSI
jgi:DNA repair protein RecO (recombination protein O)